MTDFRFIQSSTYSGVFPGEGVGFARSEGPATTSSSSFEGVTGKPPSCYREKEKKGQHTIEIAVMAIVLGSLITALGHRATFPRVTRLVNRLLKDGIGLPERFHFEDTTITRFLFGTDYIKPPPPKNLLDKGIMFLTDRPFHLFGRIGFSVAAVEFGLRSLMGYEHHLSGGGGIFSMFFWNRIGIQYWGLDRAGASLMFVIDRFADALPQVQSGENWRNVNWYYVANHYGAVTLFGTFRARVVRDWLFRRANQRLLSSVTLQSGDASSRTLIYERGFASKATLKVEQWRRGAEKVKAIGGDNKELVSTLMRSSNWNNRVWLDEQGRFFDKTGRLLGGELTASQREGLAIAVGQTRFDSLFSSSVGMKIETVGALRCLQIKVKGDANTLGFLAYWTLQEPLMSPPLVALSAALLAGEDLDKSFISAWYKAFLQFPRQYFKLHLGIDTASASFVDRVLKYTTEPYLAKFIPLFASKGLWRKHYDQAVCSDSLDEFVNYHIAPRFWEGGLFRYNREMLMGTDNIPMTILELPKRNEVRGFSGPSLYSPIGISFKLLAKYYGDPESMTLEERERVAGYIDEIIEEAKRRRQLERAKLLEYQDETVLQLARALSAAAYSAHLQHAEQFSDLVQKQRDWFDQLGFQVLFSKKELENRLETVERYVNAL
ncbi:MAG: hypothetical protein HYY44_05390 [Deltaproteobacteria bacterium]|nr:hypothetical protein [Deltaproteobacteria bacterium]